MNREEAEKLLPVFQAFIEGKRIQVYDDRNDRWKDISSPDWISGCEYRIKPNEPKKKYRPYKDHYEFLSLNDTYTWIKDKNSNTDATYLIQGYCSKGVLINGVWRIWRDLLNDYTLDDGTVIGMLVEEENE